MIKISVTPFNIIQGPGTLYIGNWTNGVQPDVSTLLGVDPGTVSPATIAGFVDAGGTTGGITVEIDETLGDITVDQVLDPIGARTTARTIQVTTTLMETQLDNLLLALNGATAGTKSGGASTDAYEQLDLTTTTSATQPIYSTVIVDGWGPTASDGTPMIRRFIIQKTLSAPKISQKFSMGDQATVDVTFTAYYTGSVDVHPLTIIDQKKASGV